MPTGGQNILKGQTCRTLYFFLIYSGIGEIRHSERGATYHFEDQSSTTNPLRPVWIIGIEFHSNNNNNLGIYQLN
jgi:hypothetical protein